MRSLITTLKIELLGKGRNGDKGQAKRTKGGEKEEKREENERGKRPDRERARGGKEVCLRFWTKFTPVN